MVDLLKVNEGIRYLREIHALGFLTYLGVNLQDGGRFRTDIEAVEAA
jgi:hypothetical protein